MKQHLPQHLLLGLAAALPLPPTTPHPLYRHYNLTPRRPAESQSDDIRHRLLLDDDFQFDFDVSADSECHSPLIEWSMAHVKEMGYQVYKELYDNQILKMPFVYKHYIDENEEDESFGYDGSETMELMQRHRDTMAFWTEADVDDTIQTDGILLLAMHGRDLMDNDKLVPTIMHMFDFHNDNDVLDFADKVREYIESLPAGYDNPLLTMNAVATTGGRKNSRGSPSSTMASLIIGDGVLQFVMDAGFASSGPDFVHAHEFGHHLQYEMDMAHNVPEGYENDIRRKELMADAISAYFLAHDRGGNMDAHEISEFSMTAFATGDCNVGQEDHHGTPKQRYCASVWGASRAALAKDRSELIDPDTFLELFNAAYGGILALDDKECVLVLEEPHEEVNYAAVSQPETSNFDTADPDAGNFYTTNADTSNPDLSFPGRDFRQDDFLFPEESEPTVWIPASTVTVFSLDEDYKATDGLTTSAGQVIDNTSPPSTDTVDQATDESDNEAIIFIAGPPSETQLHFGKGASYRCNLPWVYCSDESSSSGGETGCGTFHSVVLAASFVGTLVNSWSR